MTVAAFPVHVYAGALTEAQLDGEACAVCARSFRLGQAWVYVTPAMPDAKLARHVACHNGGTR